MMGPIMGGYPRARFTSTEAAITFDGNSIVDPIYSVLATQLQALPPINDNITISNFALSGQTIRDMINDASDVDGSYVAGKRNYLLVFEITNSIFNQGRTGLQACADLTEYLTARLNAHPWVPVVLTALPRGSALGSTYDAVTGEVQLQAANSYLRQNYRAMGARALVEVRRAGGPFDFTDSTNAENFPSSLWGDRTHPNSAGTAIIAQYIADVLTRLPAR